MYQLFICINVLSEFSKKKKYKHLIVSLCRTYLKIRESIDFEQNDFTRKKLIFILLC